MRRLRCSLGRWAAGEGRVALAGHSSLWLAVKRPARATRPSRHTHPKILLVLAFALLAALMVGCGGGVSKGASVKVYVGSSLCAEAKQALARHGGEAGDLKVAVVCFGDAKAGGRLDLAALGADARRTTEDSASVAYLEAPGPGNRFTRPIVEGAGIAYLTADSGTTAMSRLLDAIGDADSSSLRASVRSALDQT
jgi:hypothetical protein